MRKYVLILLIASFIACNSMQKISKINFSYNYKETLHDNAPGYKLVAFPDSSYRLFYTIPPGGLLYKKDEESKEYIAGYILSLKVFESFKTRNLYDSLSVLYRDTNKLQEPKKITDSIDFGIEYENSAVLKLDFYDVYKDVTISDYIKLEKKKESPHDYLFRDEHNNVYFDNVITKADTFKLQTFKKSQGVIHVRYYNREFPVASPPFSYKKSKPFDYDCDSTFTIELNSGASRLMTLEDEGFYHFQSDTTQKQGATLFRFYEGFPDITTTENLLQPLRYITSSKEFKKIEHSKNVKNAVDSFWLAIAGTHSRARQMIKEYYGKTREANMLFTSYHEGWKTDRGMIYTIFGMPKAVFKGENYEEWIYGETFHPKAINFYFMKMENPFSGKDYMLNRDVSYKDPWYISVEKIRR